METILKMNNITKLYKSQKALDNFNINIEKGDIYGFVGENGSGKTTVIRLIAGLIFQNAGDFELFGINDKDERIYEARKKIGAIVESPSIYLNMSAVENLKMQCTLLNVSEDKINETLKSVGLDNMINDQKKARNYSLGMRQRLGIAASLIHKPNVLILDEPTNDLDIESLSILEDYLEDFNGAVLVVSHDRYFLDKVVNVIYSLEDDKTFHIYNGGYSDYLEKRKLLEKPIEKKDARIKEKKIKLTYLEQKEFETIEQDMEKITSQITEIQVKIDANITNYLVTKDLYLEKEKLEKALEEKFERWEYLSEIDRQSREK